MRTALRGAGELRREIRSTHDTRWKSTQPYGANGTELTEYNSRMLVAFDSETTGKDLRHSCRPFFVTVCFEDGSQKYWCWDVNPLTREPEVPDDDLAELHDLFQIDDPDGPSLVGQNVKFDVTALASVDPAFGEAWPWSRTHDTLIAGHLLASNQPHDLTSMVLHYLGEDIQPLEKALEKAVKEARRVIQQARLRVKRGKDDVDAVLAAWKIAEEGLEGLPSAKGDAWRNDYWLPRALVKHLWEMSEAGKCWQREIMAGVKPRYVVPAADRLGGWEYRLPSTAGEDDPGHPWWTVLRDYSNADSAYTLALWKVVEVEVDKRGLRKIYETSRRRVELGYRMEATGVTVNRVRLKELRDHYQDDSREYGERCVRVAAGYDYELTLPKNGVNRSLRDFCFNVLDLPRVYAAKAKTAEPTLNKAAMDYYEQTLDPKSKAGVFVRALLGKRKRDTAIQYLVGYERFWVPLSVFNDCGEQLWYNLHPSLNPTGTDTLRWSSSNPNEQNISKQKEPCRSCRGKGCAACGGTGEVSFNLRYCFGPAPGREWWTYDAKNIELRLPAYEAGEEEMIVLFEKPDEPPYYGSNHLLNFHTVYPDLWEQELKAVGFEKVGPHCKKKYAATWYQWCKNGGFAVQYGAIDKGDGSGTADRAFHRAGSHALLKQRFKATHGPGGLNERCIKFAEKHGYVETLPDRTVDPKRGYPLMCTRTEWGRILPTVPLNYRVQGSAMWWMMMAMIRCQEQLDRWRIEDGFDGKIVLQVHDELAFDFPKRGDPVSEVDGKVGAKMDSAPAFHTSNLWRVRALQRLMEQGGSDGFGIPTPMSCSYHPVSWAEGVDL